MKVKCPLMSLEARGKIAGRLVFSKRASGQQARFQKAQVMKVLPYLQADNQSLYRVIYACWSAFSQVQKDVYNNLVIEKNLKMSGWNYFFQLAMSNLRDYVSLSFYLTLNFQYDGGLRDLVTNTYRPSLKPLYPSNCPVLADGKNKKLYKCFSFDGIDDYIDTNYTPNLSNNSDFTVVCWVNSRYMNEYNYYAVSQSHSFPPTYSSDWFLVYGTTKSIFWFRGVMLGNLDSINDGNWHQLVMVWEKSIGKYKGYVDDQYIGQSALVTSYGGVGSIKIGTRADLIATYFRGFIDNVSIYTRALSFVEIKNLYNLFK